MVVVGALAVSAASAVADDGASVVGTDHSGVTVHPVVDRHPVSLDRAHLSILAEGRATTILHSNSLASGGLMTVGIASVISAFIAGVLLPTFITGVASILTALVPGVSSVLTTFIAGVLSTLIPVVAGVLSALVAIVVVGVLAAFVPVISTRLSGMVPGLSLLVSLGLIPTRSTAVLRRATARSATVLSCAAAGSAAVLRRAAGMSPIIGASTRMLGWS